MSVEAIGNPLDTSTPSTTANAGVNQQDFIKLFVSELQFQDPMQPLDNSQFLTQLAQFVSIEQQSEEVSGINNILTLNSSNQSLGLLDRTIQFANSDGTTATGKVSGIQYDTTGVRLTVSTSASSVVTDIGLSQIQLVTP